MDNSFYDDAKESHRIEKIAEPILKELFSQIPDLFTDDNIVIFNIEEEKQKVLELLDRAYGYDYIVMNKTDNLGVAVSWKAIKCRHSQYPKSGVYNSFSLRYKRNNGTPEENCELRKRQKAIESDALYPQFLAQAHYDPVNDDILSVAVARTTDVYDAYDKGLFRDSNPNARIEDKKAFFYEVMWELMKEEGYKVYDWYKDDSCRKTNYMGYKR